MSVVEITKIERIKDNDDEVRNILNEILSKADCSQIESSNLIRLIKLEKVIKNIIKIKSKSITMGTPLLILIEFIFAPVLLN